MGGTGARAAAVEGMLFGVAQPMEEDEKKAMCEQKFVLEIEEHGVYTAMHS